VPQAVGQGLTRIGLVDSARVAGVGDATEITLWLDAAATVFAVAPLRPPARGGPAGVEVILLNAPMDAAASLLEDDVQLVGYRVPPPDPRPEPRARERGPEPRAREATPPRPEADAREWVVVVDAGHGGHDPGAHGPDGTREKDVTLAIALALQQELRDHPGIRVILTRDDDTFVPLGGRTKLANDAGADLFVSIHANSAERSGAEGFETYFLSAAVTEDARRVARMENSAIRYENGAIDPTSLDDVNFILWDLAQNEYLRESSALAEAVQVELERRLPLKSRGVKQAPFYVLKGAYMPAILFETAFISNPREEELLNDSAFQNRLADGLAESLVAFLDRYGRKTGGRMAAR
jgi:N-acetylmuramoyl-L-alanine amidase